MTDFDIAAWTRQLGKTVDSAHEAGLMDDIQAHLMRVHLGFCRAHQLAFRMPGDDVDLWGFGTASVLFAQPDGHHWWTDLVDLIEPTGLTWTDLKRAYRAEVRMHYGDTATLHYNVDGFHHEARWNPADSWIEMHLVADGHQRVTVPGLDRPVEIADGRSIRTEISTKFTVDGMGDELAAAGLEVSRACVAPDDAFALLLATPRR